MTEADATKQVDPSKQSIQSRAQDYPGMAGDGFGPGFGGMFLINIAQQADDTPPWNFLYPNIRDRFLLKFARTEPMLAGAKQSMKTRIQTLNYKWNAPPRAKKYGQELLNNPGLGESLFQISGKYVDDLIGSDNGAFLEKWMPGRPDRPPPKNAPVMGFAHLDSRQCWRSFDPEFPVWYTNPQTGEVRKLHKDRVLMQSANPQPEEMARNIGFSPVSMLLRISRIMRSTLIYRDEKITGGFTRAIGAVSGVSGKQVKDALTANESEAESKGFVLYKGIPFMVNPSTEAGNDIKIVLQDLASIPDGFEFKTDVDLYAYILALCFGVDAREFWPATQSGATKADATVQNMKARGRMIGYLVQVMEWLYRQCLPETGEFTFDYTDDEQDEMAARIHGMRLGNLNTLKAAGAINSLEMRALAIAEGIIDGVLLENLDIPIEQGDNPSAAEDEGDALQPNSNNSSEPEDENMEAAAALKSMGDYRRSIRSLVRGLWTGDLSTFDFLDGMVSSITRHFTQAWEEGAQKVGILPGEMTEAEATRLKLEINTEITYILPFAQTIVANSKANKGALGPLMDRADGWVSRYERMAALAATMAGADKKFKWVRNPLKDSCIDCLNLDGRVYRGSIWEKNDIQPRSAQLSCFGENCGCDLVLTDEPITRGRPPKLRGRSKALDTIQRQGLLATA